MNAALDDQYSLDPSHPLFLSEPGPLDLLLLEDNDVDAAVFEGAASRSSYTLHIRRAKSLAQFFSEIARKLPHVICADHNLPDGLATDALALRNKACPQSPFIVITGAGEEEIAVEYLKKGAADYLSKRQLDQFPRALENVLISYKNASLRRLAELETERLNKELLALIKHVEGERDEEKRSLSRDIHDQLGQELTALKLGLFWMQREMDKAPEKTPHLSDKVQDLLDLNSSIILQVRDIARSLRPVVLDQVGISAGIETLIQYFNRRETIFCGLHLNNLPENLSQSLQTDLFRIVQEGLTNISRHSKANFANVRLTGRPTGLLLEIGDDGQGMTLSKDAEGDTLSGLGLVGMRERVRGHNGEMKVSSKRNKGTDIQITIPLADID